MRQLLRSSSRWAMRIFLGHVLVFWRPGTLLREVFYNTVVPLQLLLHLMLPFWGLGLMNPCEVMLTLSQSESGGRPLSLRTPWCLFLTNSWKTAAASKTANSRPDHQAQLSQSQMMCAMLTCAASFDFFFSSSNCICGNDTKIAARTSWDSKPR